MNATFHFASQSHKNNFFQSFKILQLFVWVYQTPERILADLALALITGPFWMRIFFGGGLVFPGPFKMGSNILEPWRTLSQAPFICIGKTESAIVAVSLLRTKWDLAQSLRPQMLEYVSGKMSFLFLSHTQGYSHIIPHVALGFLPGSAGGDRRRTCVCVCLCSFTIFILSVFSAVSNFTLITGT